MDSQKIREIRKNRLRKNMVNSDRMTEREDKDASLLRHALIILIVLILAAAAVFFAGRTNGESYRELWEKDLDVMGDTLETFRGYEKFANGVIKYSKDGAQFIDNKGNVVWERSYQMKSPVIATSEKYACIADKGGNTMFIFNKASDTGACSTVFPIAKVSVSDVGVVYAVLNDADADYITAFRSDGSAIDLSVKSILTGDGYPFDISVSPDGTQMISSYIGIDGGEMVSSVVFRNFGEVGQNADARRVVGGFTDEFEGHIVGRVHFSDDIYSQAYYDGGIVFFSTKVLNTPEILSHEVYEEEIKSIAYGKKIIAVISENKSENDLDAESEEDENNPESETGQYKLSIYEANGKKQADVVFDEEYTDFGITGEYVYLYGHDNIKLYSKRGKKRADFDVTDYSVNSVIGTDNSRELILVSGSIIKRIKY